MQAVIRSCAAVPGRSGLRRRGSVALCISAAKEALRKAGLKPSELGMLINASLYREGHIAEPAVAAFVQEGIGANPESDGEKGTFSFDLVAGACGLIEGLDITSGFIETGSIEHGMVVAADINPDPKYTKGFTHKPYAAAVLVSGSDRGPGFIGFGSFSFPDDMELRTGRISYEKGPSRGLLKRSKTANVLKIEQNEKYLDRCLINSEKAASDFLRENGIEGRDLDLIVPSQSPEGFAAAIPDRIGTSSTNVVDMSDKGDVLTAGPGLALQEAMENGMLESAQRTLLLAVGSGMKVSMALYGHS